MAANKFPKYQIEKRPILGSCPVCVGFNQEVISGQLLKQKATDFCGLARILEVQYNPFGLNQEEFTGTLVEEVSLASHGEATFNRTISCDNEYMEPHLLLPDPVAQRIVQGGSDSLSYFHADHLGSSVKMTGAAGQVIQTIAYAPYGETALSEGAPAPTYQYTGQEKDEATDLYYYGARYYDPELGRFIQADPVLDGLNRYTYAYNNPLRYIDPSGHMPTKPTDCIGECNPPPDPPSPPSPPSPPTPTPGPGLPLPPGSPSTCLGCGDNDDDDDNNNSGSKIGNDDDDFDGRPGHEMVSMAPLNTLINQNDLGYNGWDWVPLVSNFRAIKRGGLIRKWAYDQPGFVNEVFAWKRWHECTYGACHSSRPVDPAVQISLIPNQCKTCHPRPYAAGGYIDYSMPDTPLVDIYSTGMGETTNGYLDIAYTLTAAKIMRSLPEPKINTSRFGIRIAPFGNSGGAPVSTLPHFHFRIGPALGRSYSGFGWGWHHPWDDFLRLWKYVKNTVVK